MEIISFGVGLEHLNDEYFLLGLIVNLGSYKECWSWFEALILRLNKDTGAYSEISVNGKQRLFVQSNAHATSATAIHEVEWEEDSNEDDDNYGKKGIGRGGGRGFVKAMQPGDKISLVAIARVQPLRLVFKLLLNFPRYSSPIGLTWSNSLRLKCTTAYEMRKREWAPSVRP